MLAVPVAIGLGFLSAEEHKWSVRPSDTLVLYLVMSVMSDAVWLTLPSYLDKSASIGLQLFLKLALLILESRSKRSALLESYKDLPPEECAGILSRTFFWWITGLLSKGYRENLSGRDGLPAIDPVLSSGTLREKAITSWSQQGT